MSDESDIDISVVIPLYNHAAYIGETLDSVLAQTHPAREIIVLDDGSSDDGVAIARARLAGRPGGLVLTQPNAGAHNTINRCIETATSSFIAVLNSDDNFKPEKLRRCAELLSADPTLDLVFGRVALIDQHGAAVTAGPTVDWLDRAHRFLAAAGDLDLALFNENFAVTTSNMVFRKSLWTANGGFQPLRYCHDLEFLFSSNRNHKILYDDSVDHIEYRVHPNNTIKENLTKIRVEIACVLADALNASLLKWRARDVDPRMLALFDHAVSNKGLGTLLTFLMAKRSNFETRADFFAWAIADGDVNGLLRHHLEQPFAAEPFLREGRTMERYVTGYEAPPARRNATVTSPPPLGGGPVVIELSSFDRGGLEKVVLDTSIAMKKHGLDSIIVSCGKVGHLGEIARKEGVVVYQLPEGDPFSFYADLLRRHSIKLAISHFSRTGYPVFARMGIPNVTFIHNVYAFLSGAALENFKNDDVCVDTYISVSPKATDYAVARLGIAHEKIVTVPNGLLIDEHVRRAQAATPVTREQFGLAPDDYVFLNVASYNLHKNHYLMAAALKLVLAKTQRVKILCIGNTIVPAHIDALRAHIEDSGLSAHMLMPGYFPDVAPFHAITDAFLLPSLIEGWSIAMNEAMFFGKPLLMTDTGGASEVIENRDIGLLLPNEYGDTSALHSALLDDIAYNRRHFRTAAHLAQGMMTFFENPEHWRRAGLGGRRKIMEKYDFTRMIESYYPIFEAACARNVEGA